MEIPLQDIVQQFHKPIDQETNDRKSKLFYVPKSEIIEEGYDLSYNKYKEEVFQEIVYEKPSVILDKLIGEDGLEHQIIEGLNELKELI